METLILIIVYTVVIGSFIFNTWLAMLNYKHRNEPIPEEVQDVYDTDKYKKWLEYNMENHRFSMIVRTINFIIFVLMLSLGIFVWFDDLAVSISSSIRIQTLLFLGFYFLLSFIVGIFTSYYDTFKIEEKYGFNKATKKTFFMDKVKSLILTIIFGGGLVYLILVIFKYAGNLFFLYTWLALVVIFVLTNILYVRLIVPMFNKLTPLEDGELKDAINAFAKKVGYEVAQISVIDASKRSSRLNAYFTGFGKLKKIVLYDTLIEKMSTDEIVSVLAHEIGHNKYKHIWFNMIQMTLTLLVYIGVFVLVLQNEVFSTAFGFTESNFGFSLILFAVLLEPIGVLLGLVSATFSRKHEYQADAYSAVQYSPLSMESSLKVLGRENFSNLTPHPLYVKLTYSHPPITDRIKAIRKIQTDES